MEDKAIYCDFNANDESEVERSDKPLMVFFHRLIQGGNTEETLTDAQLIDIFQNEFKINATNLHPLEMDVYLTLMKTFLKTWPGWVELNSIVNDLINKTKFKKLDVFVQQKYFNLKKYLREVFDIAIPIAKATVQNVLEHDHCDNTDGEVIMEIKTSRNSLSNLFFQYPNLKLNNTIFNIAIAEPPKTIQTVNLSLPAILNWWNVKVLIFPPFDDTYVLLYSRETKHEFKHVLMNKRLPTLPNTPNTLDQEIKVQIHGKRNKIKTYTFIDLMANIKQHYSTAVRDINELFEFILRDLSLLPPAIITSATYKRFTNKYPYVRYLYENVDHVSSENYTKYDIQLEETIKPAYQITLGNLQKVNECIDWSVPVNPVILECLSCSVIFKGSEVIHELKEHFRIFHQDKIDFSCTNCKENFEIETLSSNWWCHKC